MAQAAGEWIAMDTAAVSTAAKRVVSHAEDLRLNHTGTQAMLDDALYGCVGRSAAELAALSQRWSLLGSQHADRVDTLGRRVEAAKVAMSETDHANAQRVARVNDA